MCRGTRCTHHFNPAVRELEKDYSYDLVMVECPGNRSWARVSCEPHVIDTMFIQPLIQIKDDADCGRLHDMSLDYPCHWLHQSSENLRRELRAQDDLLIIEWGGIPQMEISPTDQSWKVTRL